MKIVNYLLLITLFLVYNCTNYDNGYSSKEIAFDNNANSDLNIKYTNQSWGFENKTPINIAVTRSINCNSNEWESIYNLVVPNEVTAEEAEYVYNYFNTTKLDKGIDIHWSDFFIQYVATYDEVNQVSERYMDYLGYESMSGKWEHVNNFNVSTHAIQYVYDAGTENWTYRSSFDDKYHNDLYTIQYLSFDINGHHYQGWYIGFDYEGYIYEDDGTLRNGSVFKDGYYNDWIVKVTPGIRIPDITSNARVMCEDLGNSYDWDYNDVVFDVSYEQLWWPEVKLDAIITLRAAGGTLPIYVGTQDSRYEIHELLGVDVSTVLINPTSPVIYRVPVANTNPKSINIFVHHTEAIYVLKAERTPQKFCCPITVKWSPELIDIRETYPKWTNWVNDNTVKFWE